MKSRIIILSDLWGNTNDEWMAAYIEALQSQFLITCYDCRKLAQIDSKLNQESDIHSQFVDGGIERAVDSLCALEKDNVTVLAFSIGGTVAWKAALKGLRVDALYSISSTRLRYESEQPACELRLIYGENDPYKPGLEWFDQQEVVPLIVEEMGHEMYKTSTVINRVCDYLKLAQHTND